MLTTSRLWAAFLKSGLAAGGFVLLRLGAGMIFALALPTVVAAQVLVNPSFPVPKQEAKTARLPSRLQREAVSRPLLPPQSGSSAPSAAPAPATDAPDIADNSFLLEEAYNQEYGVVQHISGFTRNWNTKAWSYAFTQEWPFNPAPRHQLSYTIPVVSSSISGDSAGLGDVLLNWRYQVTGGSAGDSRVAFAPRVSMVINSGNTRRGRGNGSLGVQVNLPVSVDHHPKLVTHWNAGATFLRRAKDNVGNEGATYSANLGQSFIWKMNRRFNWMLETVLDSTESVVGPGAKQRDNTLLFNPGFRWAYNFENGLQIVPGVSFPVPATGPSRGTSGILFYLSFEHSFRSAQPKK